MHHCAAKGFAGDFLAGNGLYHLRAGYEHIGGLIGHEYEVRKRGGIHRAACAGAHYGRYLRHNARCNGVAEEYVAVTGKRVNGFGYSCSAAVVKAYNGRAHFKRKVKHLAYLLCMHFAQRTAHNGEILCENIHESSVYHAVAGNHAVSGGLGIVAAFNECVKLNKAALIQQVVQPFAGGQLAGIMLLGYALFPAAGSDPVLLLVKQIYLVSHLFFSLIYVVPDIFYFLSVSSSSTPADALGCMKAMLAPPAP